MPAKPRVDMLAAVLIMSVAIPVPAEQNSPPRRAGPATSSARTDIKADVRLVLIPVSVTDKNGANVIGLRAENFSVYEDGTQRPIVSFSQEDAPCSVGIVFDVSGSMLTKVTPSQSALHAFLDAANENDEVFLMTFSDQPTLRIPFTRDFVAVQNSLAFEKRAGMTALIDAIYEALRLSRTAENGRRALLVISDGGDNYSRYSREELRMATVEADTQIYSIGIQGIPRSLMDKGEQLAGLSFLQDLADRTGGKSLVIQNNSDLLAAMRVISLALRDQYLLGIPPSERTVAGEWHKIRVKVDAPDRRGRLRVDARTIYYLKK